MKLKTQDYNNVTVVELQGELDEDFAEAFCNSIKEIISRQKKGIVLDMAAVVFIDSLGLEKLLWIKDYCDENDCQLKIAGLDENCQTILRVTRLEDCFDSYAELSAAVKSFA
jgi:anti-anti-sigma factor